MERAGFAGVEIRDRAPMSVDDAALCPMFPPELIALMRRLIPLDKQREVAMGMVFTAVLGSKDAVQKVLAGAGNA